MLRAYRDRIADLGLAIGSFLDRAVIIRRLALLDLDVLILFQRDFRVAAGEVERFILGGRIFTVCPIVTELTAEGFIRVKMIRFDIKDKFCSAVRVKILCADFVARTVFNWCVCFCLRAQSVRQLIGQNVLAFYFSSTPPAI